MYDRDYFAGRTSFFYGLTGYRDFRSYFDRLAAWFRPHVGDGPLLDVGCAYGFLLARFDDGRELHGCDVSPWALAQARRTLPAARLSEADAGRGLPYGSAHFDAVVCTDVIEHIPPSAQPHALAEMARVLLPGGHFFMTTPNQSWIRRMIYGHADRREGHVGMDHVDAWCGRLGGAGLEVVDDWTYVHGCLPGRSRYSRLLPECAVVARKA